jgi:hypothetical protein
LASWPPAHEPPLVATPPPEEDETPEDTSAALEYRVGVTASGSPVILWDETDALLRNLRIPIA